MEIVKLLPSAPSVVLMATLKGAYAAGTDYAPGDAVSYNGGVYVMHTDAAAGTAPTDTTKWQAINSPQAYVESIDALTLTNTTTDNTISVDQNGNVGTVVATDGAVHIENTGNTGIGLGVYTDIGATAAAPLVHLKANNTAFDQNVLKIENLSTANTSTVVISSAGVDGTIMSLTSTGATSKVLYVLSQGTTNRNTLHVTNTTVFTGTTNTSNVYIELPNAAASGDCLGLSHVGTGIALRITKTGSAGNAQFIDMDDTGTSAGLYIDRDGNNAAKIFGLKIDVDNAGSGNLVGGIDLSSFAAGEALLKVVADATDPTAGGGAAVGRIAIDVAGDIKYVAYY